MSHDGRRIGRGCSGGAAALQHGGDRCCTGSIALALGFQLALGFSMPKDESGFALFQLHKSVGITILLLSLARLAWRLTHRPPPAVEGGLPGLPRQGGAHAALRVHDRHAADRLGGGLDLADRDPDGVLGRDPLAAPAALERAQRAGRGGARAARLDRPRADRAARRRRAAAPVPDQGRPAAADGPGRLGLGGAACSRWRWSRSISPPA